jgi:predicted metalloprotease with PDZ domain
MKPVRCFPLLPVLAVALATALGGARLAAQPATVAVDATEAPRKIFHGHLVLPASPGPLTLLYPKWIPGEHGPTGPLVNFMGLRFTAAGRPLAWQRDPVDMYAFHVEVPAGMTSIEADYDFLSPGESGIFTSGSSTSSNLSVLSWNTLLLYPAGKPGEELPFTASLRLPAGWQIATPLPEAGRTGDTVRFQTVSMTTLIDSPVLLAVNLKKIPLPTGPWPPHEIDVATDSPAYLAPPEGFAASYGRLVAEAHALFGAHHYTQYHWLLTLSEHVAHFGLEHHEASDNRMPEATLTEEALRYDLAGLLAHEFVHSWNGKYRRPQGLVDPDYHEPMQGELLWVYEGLTQFLGGYLLPARSGLWTPEQFHERLAVLVANLDHNVGRTWRPLADTAVAAQIVFGAPAEGRTWRRGSDFYDESVLIWLEADTIIRKATGGKRSMDDFCHRFHGGETGPPKVVPYTFDDVVATLNEIAPHDWRAFFQERLNGLSPQAPRGGLEAAGWQLVYDDKPNPVIEGREERNKQYYWTYSLGMEIKDDGTVRDIVPGLPAAKAGIAPGMKLVAVDGRAWTKELVDAAIRQAKGGSTPIELLLSNDDFYKTYRVDYHGGPRYPHLVRREGRDLLSEIFAPHAGK